jgi:predicted dehydrogenase
MPLLADLHRAVEATLAAGRLGTPVFVRYHLESPQAQAAVRRELDQIQQVVQGWLRREVERAHVVDGGRHACTAVEYRSGPLAVVSGMACTAGPPNVSLIVLGNRGALYHEGIHSDQWAESLPAPESSAGAPAEGLRGAPYGVLLVTGGHTHQETYAAAFAADPRCRIMAVTDEADIDATRLALNERLATTLGVPYVADLEQALTHPGVNVVSVCAPPERRGRIAVRCAQAGKHLYLDKSLAPDVKAADAIVAAVRQAGVKSHMFSFISRPWARQARRLLEDGQLGRLLAIHADVLFAKGRPGSARLGRRREEFPPRRHQVMEAKRELDNVGVYPITLIRWLTGQRFQHVRAVTANFFFVEHQQHNVEDFGLLTGTLEDGLPVTIAAGRCGWTSHPASGVNRLLLVGTQKTVVVDANRPLLEVYTDEPPWAPPEVHPEDPMGFWDSTLVEAGMRPKRTWVPTGPAGASDAAYFLDCLDAGRDSDINAAEAALATEVLVAAYRSASTRQGVTLPLPRDEQARE